MITFIIPAYQAEKTIRRTIESCIRQTSDQWKIIIVNDGSVDKTEEICLSYQERYSDKITYLYQKNSGLGKARNTAIPLVTTEYISFLDSDDWLMPDYVESVIFHASKEHPEMIMVLPLIYHEESRAVREWYDKEVFEYIFPKDGTVIHPAEHSECYRMEVNVCRKVLRKEFIDRLNFRFTEGIKWEDVYPHFYLLSNCRSCMGIKNVGFYYRVGSSEQITASRGKDRLDILGIFKELRNYIEESKNEKIKFAAMRLFIRFSIWCIRMTEKEVRVTLIHELTSFFKKLPRSYYRELRKGIKKNYSKKDALQYILFYIAIRRKCFRWIFYDYLYEDAATKIIKKILGAGERVA